MKLDTPAYRAALAIRDKRLRSSSLYDLASLLVIMQSGPMSKRDRRNIGMYVAITENYVISVLDKYPGIVWWDCGA